MCDTLCINLAFLSHICSALSIQMILQREKEWSDWKNKGCPDYTHIASDKQNSFKR